MNLTFCLVLVLVLALLVAFELVALNGARARLKEPAIMFAFCLACALAATLAVLDGARAQLIGGGINNNTITYNSLPVITVIPAASNVIATANTLQTVFGPAAVANGCYIHNVAPGTVTNLGNLVVEPTGITGTTLDPAAVILQPGQYFNCPGKPTTAITVTGPAGMVFVAARY